MTMTPRHAHILIAFLSASFLGIALLFYWAVLDGVYVNRVTSADTMVYQTNKTSYKEGESVQVSVTDFCKYRDISANTYINLVDTVYYPYEVKHRSIPTGCPIRVPSSFGVFVELPKHITGTYHLSGYHSYDINPIRKGNNGIKVFFTSNDFEITE